MAVGRNQGRNTQTQRMLRWSRPRSLRVRQRMCSRSSLLILRRHPSQRSRELSLSSSSSSTRSVTILDKPVCCPWV